MPNKQRVERQQQRGGDIRPGDVGEHEGEEKPDRQAAGVAKKDLRRMLVEDGEAKHGAEQRQRQKPTFDGTAPR